MRKITHQEKTEIVSIFGRDNVRYRFCLNIAEISIEKCNIRIYKHTKRYEVYIFSTNEKQTLVSRHYITIISQLSNLTI